MKSAHPYASATSGVRLTISGSPAVFGACATHDFSVSPGVVVRETKMSTARAFHAEIDSGGPLTALWTTSCASGCITTKSLARASQGAVDAHQPSTYATTFAP